MFLQNSVITKKEENSWRSSTDKNDSVRTLGAKKRAASEPFKPEAMVRGG
jgi:hypothetical protein